MKGTVSISIERLLEIVMAHAAAAELDGIRPCMLGKDNKAMLAVLADREITALASELPEIIKDIEEDGDKRVLSVETRDSIPLRVWRRNFETAICCGILAHAWSGGIGSVYAADRTALIENFRSAAPFPGRIERA